MVKMYKISFTGRIHGIGFRYAVLQYAKSHGLVGTVRNIPDGTEIIINDKDFLKRFDPPVLSRIDSQTIEEADIVVGRYKDFQIINSSY